MITITFGISLTNTMVEYRMIVITINCLTSDIPVIKSPYMAEITCLILLSYLGLILIYAKQNQPKERNLMYWTYEGRVLQKNRYGIINSLPFCIDEHKMYRWWYHIP